MSFNVNTFNSDNWHRDAISLARRNAIKTRRWGMRVTVYQGVDAGDWVLSYGLNSTDLQDNDNWLKVADIGDTWGGGGGGVNIYNSDGTLTGHRSFDGDGFQLDLGNFEAISLDADSIQLEGDVNLQFVANSGPGASSIIMDVDMEIATASGTIGINAASDIYIDSATAIYLNANGAGVGLDSSGVDITGDVNPVQLRSEDGADDTLVRLTPTLILLQSDNDIDLDATGDYLLKGLAAASPSTEFFRGDGTWAVPAGGTTYTFENGTEEISPGVVGLGSPLTQNTLINGGTTFDFALGTFLTDPIGSFQVWAAESMSMSVRDPGTGLGGLIGIGTGGGGTFSVSLGPIVMSNTAVLPSAGSDVLRMARLSDNNNDIGTILSLTGNTDGTAAAGFGIKIQWNLEHTGGTEDPAMIDQVFWEVPTDNANYSNYTKQLRVNNALVDVIDITTNSTAPNIFTTLFGQIIMPDLPTADPAISGYLYMDGGTGALFVSL